MSTPTDPQLTAWLAGDLDEAAGAAVRAAVEDDPAVAARADRIADVMAGLAMGGTPAAPPGLAEELLAGIGTALGIPLGQAAAGQASTGPVPKGPAPTGPAGRSDAGRPGGGSRSKAAAARLQRLSSGLVALLLVVTTGGLLARSLRDGPAVPPDPAATNQVQATTDGDLSNDRPSANDSAADGSTDGVEGAAATGDPEGRRTSDPAPSANPGAPPSPGTGGVARPGGTGGTGAGFPDADGSAVTPSPPRPPGSAGTQANPTPQPSTSAGQGGQTPPPPAPAPPPPAPPAAGPSAGPGQNGTLEDPSEDPGSEGPSGQPAPLAPDEAEDSDDGQDPDDASDDADAPPPAPGAAPESEPESQPDAVSTDGPTIADSMADLPTDADVRAYFGGRPESGALIGTAEDEAQVIAAEHRNQVRRAGPFADGTRPAACLDTALAGSSPAVIAAVESVTYNGQSGVAYLVVRGAPTLDHADVLIAIADGCQVVFAGPVAT